MYSFGNEKCLEVMKVIKIFFVTLFQRNLKCVKIMKMVSISFKRNVERFLKLLCIPSTSTHALQGNDYVSARAVMFPASC